MSQQDKDFLEAKLKEIAVFGEQYVSVIEATTQIQVKQNEALKNIVERFKSLETRIEKLENFNLGLVDR